MLSERILPNIKTLIQLLEIRKELYSSGITCIEGGDEETFLSYPQLYDEALKALHYLQSKGLKPGSELVFQIDDNQIFVIVFWACILGGIYPVPLTVGTNEDHKNKLLNIWPVLNDPFLIISEYNSKKSNLLSKTDILGNIEEKIIYQENVRSSENFGSVHNVQEDDIAFIQFSSGSTGNPKGVILTHKNLVTNVRAISEASGYSATDRMISWMPLTHDMGLIGFHINPLFIGMSQYLIPTNVFVRRPSLWLQKAHEHQCTILCSPNFGYNYTLKHFNRDNDTLDLSSVRLIYNGAEPVSVNIIQEFLEVFCQYGLNENAIRPVYGLAEASLAVSIPDMNDKITYFSFSRDHLNFGDKVVITQENENSLSFVNVGKAINDCQIRIADEQNNSVDEEIIGEIQIKGDNVTGGYYNNASETENIVISDKWVRTGDLGFMKNGSLYVTGRMKDIIFINGQNYYPHDIERVAEAVENIELNKIVAVGHYDETAQKEEIITFVFHRGSLENFIPIAQELKSKINIEMGIDIDMVIPVKDIPRTTSGKLQRFKLLNDFKNGKFEEIQNRFAEVISKIKTEEKEEPANETEQYILNIWKKILKQETLGVTDKFFESGGNSLKAAELSMLLFKELQAELPISVLYTYQTVKELAAIIQNLEKKAYVSIPKIKSELYPLASMQKRLYYAWEMDKESTAYNTPLALKIKGNIDIVRLNKAVEQIIKKHDALRITFKNHSEPAFKINEIVVCETIQHDEVPSEINSLLKDRVRPFDLINGPLFRVEIFKGETETILFLDFHHIISDGLSIYNFLNELMVLYDGKESEQYSAGYGDFSYWEKDYLKSDPLNKQKEFWIKELEGELPVLDFPLDFQRPSLLDYNGQRLEFVIDQKKSSQLKKIALKNNCTLHVLLFSVYNILLSKYTGKRDLIVGIPVAGRMHPDLQTAQGMFVNNLAVKNKIDSEETIESFLKKVNNKIEEVLLNQEYPFSLLLEELDYQKDSSRNPVFDTMFVYQNMGFPEYIPNDFSFSRHFFDSGTSKFDISMEVFDYEESLKYYIEYATHLFRKETILEFQKHFEILIDKIISDSQCRLQDIILLSEEDYKQQIINFNDTESAYPKQKTVVDYIEEQAQNKPDKIALRFENQNINYFELNVKADQLSSLLDHKGIKEGDIVGILMKRSPEFIISMLGILKSGATFLPLDSDLPQDRLHFILQNSESVMVITDENHKTLIQDDVQTLIYEQAIHLQNEIKINKRQHNSESTAYVIYTSGTTGNPKGVMISQKSLLNYTLWAAEKYINKREISFPFFTSVSFDLTITSLFTPLVTGNTIIIYPEDPHNMLIEKVIFENKSDIIKLTPSHLKIVDQLDLKSLSEISVKTFIVGGEELEQSLAQRIYTKFGSKIEIYNEYGPTEATVGCMIYQFNSQDSYMTVPIGGPIHNSQIYLLNENLKPVPTGVKGDLYIAGDGLAQGYLNNESLTQERFINNPFVEGTKMYRSGDTARRLSNNILEYINRTDNQVKINGYRVELLEIENSIIQNTNIEHVVVICNNTNSGSKKLEAYYLKPSDVEIDSQALKNILSAVLPHYMIPAVFVAVDEIPLTKNGKVDHSKLIQLGSAKAVVNKTIPANKMQEICTEIWMQIFNEEDISVNDNFYELGGDSIKAVQISSRLLERGIVLKAKDILQYPTIELSSSYAKVQKSETQYEQGLVVGKKGFTPIESWFFENKFENPNYFNQSLVLTVKKEVNISYLALAFEKLIQHHDGLRLKYNADENVLFIDGYHTNSFSVNEYFAQSEEEFESFAIQLKNSLNLSDGLLIKACIIYQSGKDPLLLITAHHLVMDGFSWRILLEDLFTSYSAIEEGKDIILPKKTISLLEWKKEIDLYNTLQNFRLQEEYWKNIQSSDNKLPRDFAEENIFIRDANKISEELSEEKTNFLLKVQNTYKVNVNTILTTALALSLKEWTGKNDFVIELENHGRHLENTNASRTIGWFTAMYPAKIEVSDNNIEANLIAVKEQLSKIPDLGIGYGINKYMNLSLNDKKELIPEIRFNYLGQFGQELSNSLFSYSAIQHGMESHPDNRMTAKIEINMFVINGKFCTEIIYNTMQYKEKTMLWILDSFFKNIINIIEYIQTENNVYLTPSDFDSVELDQQELNSLFF
ncbi:amino acid adenylation domain-containing protein [Chryseobacterium sp. PS-8]|uniref:Amino acid adenylation domain-containing protein n=1 Tax=Chryseobacterium indicum TaxID=2766954 RepID=A0ABS9C6Y5_9FLAO|nr:non-ribosomal peptide synthetase [Chryseobacterium sp. PS-8]MCF2220315.1 amino acid adenylation domain-containing protein [Chryseobacterium sp. PS-8]